MEQLTLHSKPVVRHLWSWSVILEPRWGEAGTAVSPARDTDARSAPIAMACNRSAIWVWAEPSAVRRRVDQTKNRVGGRPGVRLITTHS